MTFDGLLSLWVMSYCTEEEAATGVVCGLCSEPFHAGDVIHRPHMLSFPAPPLTCGRCARAIEMEATGAD